MLFTSQNGKEISAKFTHSQLLKKEAEIPLWHRFSHSFTGAASLQSIILLRALSPVKVEGLVQCIIQNWVLPLRVGSQGKGKQSLLVQRKELEACCGV